MCTKYLNNIYLHHSKARWSAVKCVKYSMYSTDSVLVVE